MLFPFLLYFFALPTSSIKRLKTDIGAGDAHAKEGKNGERGRIEKANNFWMRRKEGRKQESGEEEGDRCGLRAMRSSYSFSPSFSEGIHFKS